jgi:HAD superfamily hydrolase (TIGR01549 family)
MSLYRVFKLLFSLILIWILNNMPIKLVTIDFWNTLFDSSGGIERNKLRMRALVNEIDKFNVMVNQDLFNSAMKASWDFFNGIWENEQRTPGPKETITYLWNYLHLPESEDSINILAEQFAQSGIDIPPKVIDGVADALEELSRKYALGIVSDTGFTSGSMLRGLLQKDELLKYFTYFSFSDETGVSKPQALAFTTILDKANIQPHEAIHIGDIEKTDIIGAKSIGMHAIRFSGDETGIISKRNPKQTIADAELFSWDEIVKKISELDAS